MIFLKLCFAVFGVWDDKVFCVEYEEAVEMNGCLRQNDFLGDV